MRNLLEISNNLPVPSPYTLAIQEFTKLYLKDKSKGKETAIKELSYIYFKCDHNSPYVIYDEEEKELKIKESLFGENSKWSPDAEVKAACIRYLSLTDTHAVLLLKSARKSVRKLEKYFDAIDLTLVDDHGKPLYSAKDLVVNLSKIGDVVVGLSKLEELVKKEDQEHASTRGKVELNKYNT
tara:strand:+ start:13596 stop:14141 length:546 start_codon:yes stop_codon:yes gene_type:complete